MAEAQLWWLNSYHPQVPAALPCLALAAQFVVWHLPSKRRWGGLCVAEARSCSGAWHGRLQLICNARQTSQVCLRDSPAHQANLRVFEQTLKERKERSEICTPTSKPCFSVPERARTLFLLSASELESACYLMGPTNWCCFRLGKGITLSARDSGRGRSFRQQSCNPRP